MRTTRAEPTAASSCAYAGEAFPVPEQPAGPRRPPAAASPQGMAVTLLADYGLRARPWIPSGAIVALLAESGITPGSARAAISRLSRRGALESSRQGRHTSYRLTAANAASLALGGGVIARFPAEAESWDGRWTLVAFSVPHAGDAERRALRNQLRWLGYAPLFDALWISPLAPPDGTAAELAGSTPGATVVFRARWLDIGGTAGRDPLDAWDLAGVRTRYEAFLERWSPLLPRIRAGTVAGAEALRARTAVMDTYRHFLSLDPRLPMRLMPAGWPRERAQQVFTAVYDGLLDAALRHVTRTVAQFVEDPPEIAAHTVADLHAGLVPET